MYYEIILSDVRDRGKFIKQESIKNVISANALINPYYFSYYMYDESVIQHYTQHNSLSGYEGNRYIDKILLDIDNQPAAVVYEIFEYLTLHHEIEEDNVKIWFSGNKGYHLQLPDIFGIEPSFDLPSTLIETIKNFMGSYAELVDYAPMQKTGIIRAPWSKHDKGTCKIYMNAAQLAQIAKDESYLDLLTNEPHKQFGLHTPFTDDDDKRFSEFIVTKKAENHLQKNDMDKPNSMVTCMQKLLLRGSEPGRRHQDSLRLVSNWRRQGIPHSYASTLLSEWLGEPLGDFQRIVNDVYTKGYAYSCKDEVMTEFCDKACMFFKKKNYVLEVQPASNMQEEYMKYLDKIDDICIDIIKNFGLPGTYKILPGEMAIVTGDTGSGKTAFVQNLLMWNQFQVLYLNLEMNPPLLYRRFLQTALEKNKVEINRMFREEHSFENYLGWIDFIHDAPHIDDIERLVTQKQYEILVVDTSDGVITNDTNEYTRLGEIINKLLAIAKNKNMIVILIHHIKKGGARGKITLDDLSGNRANVTKMDHVFKIEGAERYKIFSTLKSRDDGELELHLSFNYNHFTFQINNDYKHKFSLQ